MKLYEIITVKNRKGVVKLSDVFVHKCDDLESGISDFMKNDIKKSVKFLGRTKSGDFETLSYKWGLGKSMVVTFGTNVDSIKKEFERINTPEGAAKIYDLYKSVARIDFWESLEKAAN